MTNTALDIAAYFLENKPLMPKMKLIHLTYLCQVYSFATDGIKVFDEPVYAWSNSVCIPSLWEAVKDLYHVEVNHLPENLKPLSSATKRIADSVLSVWGENESLEIREYIQSSILWKDARKGIPVVQREGREISFVGYPDTQGHSSQILYYLVLRSQGPIFLGEIVLEVDTGLCTCILYGDNWEEYSTKKVFEKNTFPELLEDICSSIKQELFLSSPA